jgi:hypothetical protein
MTSEIFQNCRMVTRRFEPAKGLLSKLGDRTIRKRVDRGERPDSPDPRELLTRSRRLSIYWRIAFSKKMQGAGAEPLVTQGMI